MSNDRFEGVTVVKAVRDRHDGIRRNPWNEFECGSNYARSMASYALLNAFSGFGGLAEMLDPSRVDLVAFHRMISTQHAPHHVSDEGHAHWCCVVRDFACYCASSREQVIFWQQLFD